MEARPELDVLLVTVTPVEGEAVLAHFSQAEARPLGRRFVGDHTYHDFGTISGTSVCWMQSGMGSGALDGSLATIDDAIRDLAPVAVVMPGIAFGLNPQQQEIGDILLARQLVLYELQRVGVGPEAAAVIRGRGDRVTASPRLVDRFRSGVLDWQGARVHAGLVLSGEKLVDNSEARRQLLQLEPEAIGGEMEGAGLYVAAQRHKVDWILVKAISDWADGSKGLGGREYQRRAAHNAAAFVRHVLGQGGLGPAEGRRQPVDRPAQTPAHAAGQPTVAPASKYNVQIGTSGTTVLGDDAQVTVHTTQRQDTPP